MNGMKFAIYTSGYRFRSLEQAFIDARSYGYDGLELCGERPHAYAPDLHGSRLAQILRWSDQYQVPVIGYCPKVNGYPFNLMLGDRDIWEDSLAYVRRTLDTARELGAGFSVIAFGQTADGLSRAQKQHRMQESLLRLADHAARRETLLLIEPLTVWESDSLCSAAELAALLKQVDCPYIAGMCDTVVPFTRTAQGGSPETLDTYFDLLGPRLRHIHMTDSDGHTESHVLPGHGIAPLKDMLSTLRRRGYEGYITIELVSMYLSAPTYCAEAALAHMRRLEAELLSP